MFCTPVFLPPELTLLAAETAIAINPMNAPASLGFVSADDDLITPQAIAALTSKWWKADGEVLTVGFLEPIQADLRERILSHANAWYEFCNIKYVWSQTSPQVRITREGRQLWSYVGTDSLSIPSSQPTMMLGGFTMQTPESEYRRGVRHEFGHQNGCPHEHMRREIVQQIDPQKAIAYFWRTQGWTAQQVHQQVLVPIEERALLGTPHADEQSIMTYSLPAEIMKDGQPVLGGKDFSQSDREYMAKVYPKPNQPKPDEPAKPTGGGMSEFLKTFLLSMLRDQLDRWIKDGTLQRWLEELLKKLASGQVQSVAQLDTAASEAYKAATTV